MTEHISLSRFAAIVALYACVNTCFSRDISISHSTATDYFEDYHLVDGAWEVFVQGRGSPDMQLYVRAVSGNNPIRHIKVKPLGANKAVYLHVTENGGTVSNLSEIIRIDAGNDRGELVIADVVVTGSLGVVGDSSKTISAEIVSNISVGGSIFGPIIAGPRLFDVTDSTIINISSSGGDLLSHVSALYGSIDNIDVAGNIGSSSNTVNIYAYRSIKSVIADSIWANIDSTQNGGQENIWYVKTRTGDCNGSITAKFIDSTHEPAVSGLSIAGDLNANVTTLSHLREPIVVGGSVPSGTTIDIKGQVLTRAPSTGDNGSIIVGGDYAGTLSVGDMLYGPVNISGSLTSSGVIRVTSDVVKQTVTPTNDYKGSMTFGGDCAGLVRIGGSLSGPITCSTNSGMVGQVVINAANTSGSWTNTANSLVTLKDNTGASVVLAPNQPPPRTAPYYDVASSGLGGGAIGLVPYHLYPTDCDPPYAAAPGATLFDSQFNQRNPLGHDYNNRSVKLRFYGPVFAEVASTPALLIEYNTGSQWIDVSHRAYIIAAESADSTSREIEIHGGIGEATLMWGEYRVSPVVGRLKCAGTTAATPPDVASFTYYFKLLSDCNKNLVDDQIDVTTLWS